LRENGIMMTQEGPLMRTTIPCLSTVFLPCFLFSCGPGQEATPPMNGEPAAAGLPGEGVDPEFEGIEFPYDGNEDPGAG
jgi:hypothetical protein